MSAAAGVRRGPLYPAVTRFEQGFHCAQSGLAAYAGGELSEEAALRMGAALAEGSTVGGECGTVAAGYLVLGLKHGRSVPAFGDVARERDLFDRIRRFVEEFRERHGAITCHGLLGVDVFTPDGLAGASGSADVGRESRNSSRWMEGTAA